MNSLLAKFKMPVFISTFLVLPFILLELVNRRAFNEGFPFPLFGSLWLLALAFTFSLTAFVRKVRTGERGPGNIVRMGLLLAVIGASAMVFVGALIDQMPCFFGVPNCD